jgi:hypothetical protein
LTTSLLVREPRAASRRGVSLALIAFAAACFDTENDDLEILDATQRISVVNTNPSAVLGSSSEWVCEARSSAAPKTCKLLTRAKRVNAYPDGVELVFREGGERPMTREFALEIVARAAVAQGLAESNPMCDAPTHGAKLRMNFVNQVQHATYD